MSFDRECSENVSAKTAQSNHRPEHRPHELSDPMSRSRKKQPGGGIAVADSDKPYKICEHRRERRHVQASLRRGEEPLPRDFGNPYKSPKDGKTFWTDHDAKWMRK